MFNRDKNNNSDQVIDFLQKKIADLENPNRFEVGMKVRAEGKASINHIVYEGDIIEAWYNYKPESTNIDGFSNIVRINYYKIYNTRSKTVHEVLDMLFNIEDKNK